MRSMLRILLLVLAFPLVLNAQQDRPASENLPEADRKYLEDQLFFQLSYVTLKNLYPGIKQQGFSNSVSFGFIRDIPLNVRRNIGLGVGLGFERTIYFQNLRIKVDEQSGAIGFELLDPDYYRINAFGIKRLIVPLELRLRGSKADKFKFWRLYAGLTFGYVLSAFSEFENANVSIKYRNLHSIPSKYQYGIHLYAGYADLNGYIYFGLNDLFSPEVKVNDTHIPMQDIRFGVMLSFL